MTTSTPSIAPAASTSEQIPTATQTTSISNNGEPSQPKPTKPQSAKPTPKGKADKGKETKDDAGSKSKSAKELKKEKRAALVAARGGDDGEPSGSGNPTKPAHSHGNGEKVSIDGTPQPAHTSQRGANNVNLNDSSLQPNLSAQRQEGFYSHVITHKTPDTREAFNSGRIHPLVVRLGVLMANGELRGANARTMGMMSAFKEVIADYETPENVVMWKDLMSHLSPMISFLEGCRPKGTGGGNAIRYVYFPLAT